MGRRKTPGLTKRAGVWHVDKHIGGRRVCQSTGTTQLEEAERFLARLIETARQAQVYGVRPTRTFEQAAASVDMISGTSVGAKIGTIYAPGLDVDYAVGRLVEDPCRRMVV